MFFLSLILTKVKRALFLKRLSRDLSTSNYFNALNGATSNYLFVEVASGVEVSDVFNIVNHSQSSEEEYSSFRIFLWMNEGASLSVLETSDKNSSMGISNFVLDANLQANASLLRYDLKGASSDLSFSKCVVDCAEGAATRNTLSLQALRLKEKIQWLGF